MGVPDMLFLGVWGCRNGGPDSPPGVPKWGSWEPVHFTILLGMSQVQNSGFWGVRNRGPEGWVRNPFLGVWGMGLEGF